jgi:hypothetical protein
MNKPSAPVPKPSDPRPPWLWVVVSVGIIVLLMLVLFRHGDDLLTKQGVPPERATQADSTR